MSRISKIFNRADIHAPRRFYISFPVVFMMKLPLNVALQAAAICCNSASEKLSRLSFPERFDGVVPSRAASSFLSIPVSISSISIFFAIVPIT